MYIKRIKNNHGFTLLEIIVSAGIFSLLGTITIMFLTQCTSNWRRLTNDSDLRSTGRNDIIYMARELGNATNIFIPPGAGNNHSITFNLPCNNASIGVCCRVPPALRTNDPTMLINDPKYPPYPLVDPDGNTQWDTCNTIQYSITNHQLQRLVNGVISHVISPDAFNVTFENNSINAGLNIDEIEITLTLTRPMLAGNILTTTLRGIVKLRNQQ